jgi:hypothetical protein
MSLIRNNPKSQVCAAAIIIAVVAAIDAAGVLFVGKPLLWATVVPVMIPVLLGVFIILPIINSSAKG